VFADTGLAALAEEMVNFGEEPALPMETSALKKVFPKQDFEMHFVLCCQE
jgi:hypothetical protein